MSYFEPDEPEEWMEGPTNEKTVLKAITRLKEDIVRIETCESIDRYIRGPRDIIHERLDGLVEHMDNIFEEGFLSKADKHDMKMGRE